MRIEGILLILMWVGVPILLWIATPKGKGRDLFIVFLYVQLLSWLFDLVAVQLHWQAYPYREFQHATTMGFTLHFLLYPAIGALIVLYDPKRHKIVYTLVTAALYTGVAFALEQTDLITFRKWNVLTSYLTSLFYVSTARLFYVWFRKGLQEDRGRYDGVEERSDARDR